MTAFDGTETRQSIFQTQDFRFLTGRRLDGDLAFRKGAAWFPRRIGGRYQMLGRLDEESIFLLASDDPYEWTGGEAIIRPRFPWEFVQMGNCGSPIEIDEGWLVPTHGVGRARRCCMPVRESLMTPWPKPIAGSSRRSLPTSGIIAGSHGCAIWLAMSLPPSSMAATRSNSARVSCCVPRPSR